MIGMNQNDPVKQDYLQFLHYLKGIHSDKKYDVLRYSKNSEV